MSPETGLEYYDGIAEGDATACSAFWFTPVIPLILLCRPFQQYAIARVRAEEGHATTPSAGDAAVCPPFPLCRKSSRRA